MKQQAVTMFIAVVFVITGVAKPANAQNLARFRGGIGVIPSASTAGTPNVVRNVQPAGQIWVIRDLASEIKSDGRIRVDGRGLLLGGGNAIGGNANARVIATLLCTNDGNIEHNSTLAGVALEANGDFTINDVLVPATPDTCDSPVLLIRNAGNLGWFAAGIPDLN